MFGWLTKTWKKKYQDANIYIEHLTQSRKTCNFSKQVLLGKLSKKQECATRESKQQRAKYSERITERQRVNSVRKIYIYETDQKDIVELRRKKLEKKSILSQKKVDRSRLRLLAEIKSITNQKCLQSFSLSTNLCIEILNDVLRASVIIANNGI